MPLDEGLAEIIQSSSASWGALPWSAASDGAHASQITMQKCWTERDREREERKGEEENGVNVGKGVGFYLSNRT